MKLFRCRKLFPQLQNSSCVHTGADQDFRTLCRGKQLPQKGDTLQAGIFLPRRQDQIHSQGFAEGKRLHGVAAHIEGPVQGKAGSRTMRQLHEPPHSAFL